MHDKDNTNGTDLNQRKMVELITDVIGRLEQGETVSLSQLNHDYPNQVERIQTLIPMLTWLGADSNKDADGTSAKSTSSTREMLGDFQIIREIGRGGMGIVYEARQISLGKRVALKVLPFAGVLHKRALQRFQNEARAAAQLQHANIVPVHAVGCERGIHYYAMQYIDGSNLAQVVHDLRHVARRPTEKITDAMQSTATADRKDINSGSTEVYTPPLPRPASDTGETHDLVGFVSTKRSTSSPEFFATIARLGIQVADALQHAHDLGIVHRDIKPSNLLLDTQGNCWVTDFGLAQIEGDPSLTNTGEFVGTLRYMSPEQALAKRVVVDHRTDIYSFGVTLYEMLTLRHAFNGQSRQEVLRQIAFEEPRLPRKVNRKIPVELETIVMKALAKNPDERYQTAREIAEDLAHFQNDEPIRARPPNLVQRATKWSRRHKTLVACGAISAVIVFATSVVSSFLVWGAYGQTIVALESEKLAVESEKQKREEVTELLQRSEGLRLVANSLLEVDRNPGLAVLLAIQGAKRHPGREANNALISALKTNHEHKTLIAHGSPVGCARFSPDGRKVITTATRGWFNKGPEPARIWDAVSGKLLKTLDDQTTITSAVFSPTGGRVLTTSSPVPGLATDDEQGSVVSQPCLWDVVEGRKLLSLKDGFLGEAHPDAFSPDGNKLVTPGLGNTARVWDVVDGREILRLEGHKRRVVFSAFSRDGRKIVTVSDDNTVRVWNAETGAMVRHLDWWERQARRGDRRAVDSAVFSPDASHLLTGSTRYGVHLWNIETGERVNESGWPGRIGLFSPNGEQIVCYMRFGRAVDVRDAATNVVQHELRVSRGGLNSVDISSDGRLILTCTTEGNVEIWLAESGERVAELRGHDSVDVQATFSPNGRRVVSASSDRTARIWNVESGAQHARFGVEVDRLRHPVFAVSSDSRQFLVASKTSMQTIVWDPDTGTQGHTFDGRPGPNASSTRVVTTTGRRIVLWDLQTGEPIDTLTSTTGDFLNAAVSPDGSRVLAVGSSGPTWLWEPTTGRKRVLTEQTDSIRFGAFDPAGKRVATASDDGSCRIYSVTTVEKPVKLSHEADLLDLSFSSDGQRLLTITDNDTAVIWNTVTGERITTISDKDVRFNRAKFSSDGAYVLTYRSYKNDAIRCWDAATGRLVRSLEGVNGKTRVSLSPNKPEVVVVSDETGAILWKYETGESRTLTTSATGAAVFTDDGDLVVTASSERLMSPDFLSPDEPPDYASPVLQAWDAGTGELVKAWATESGAVIGLRSFPQQRRVLAVTRRYQLAVVDLESRQQIATLAGHAAPVSFAAFTPNGRLVVSSSWDQTAAVWDVGTGRRLHLFTGHTAAIVTATLSRDGQVLATGGANGECLLWEVTKGKKKAELGGHTDQINFIAFSPDGKRVLTGSRDGSIRIADLDLNQVVTIQHEQDAIAWADFSPDGKGLLVVPGYRQTAVRIRTAPDAQDVYMIEAHARERGDSPQDQPYMVKIYKTIGGVPVTLPHEALPRLGRFSPVGDTVLTVTAGGEAIIWNANSGEKIQTLKRAGKPISLATFSPDGKAVLTDHGTTLSLWDTATGKAIFELEYAGGYAIRGLSPFTQDNQWLVLISEDHGVSKWPRRPLGIAETTSPRQLTPQEKLRFGIRD